MSNEMYVGYRCGHVQDTVQPPNPARFDASMAVSPNEVYIPSNK